MCNRRRGTCKSQHDPIGSYFQFEKQHASRFLSRKRPSWHRESICSHASVQMPIVSRQKLRKSVVRCERPKSHHFFRLSRSEPPRGLGAPVVWYLYLVIGCSCPEIQLPAHIRSCLGSRCSFDKSPAYRPCDRIDTAMAWEGGMSPGTMGLPYKQERCPGAVILEVFRLALGLRNV